MNATTNIATTAARASTGTDRAFVGAMCDYHQAETEEAASAALEGLIVNQAAHPSNIYYKLHALLGRLAYTPEREEIAQAILGRGELGERGSEVRLVCSIMADIDALWSRPVQITEDHRRFDEAVAAWKAAEASPDDSDAAGDIAAAALNGVFSTPAPDIAAVMRKLKVDIITEDGTGREEDYPDFDVLLDDLSASDIRAAVYRDLSRLAGRGAVLAQPTADAASFEAAYRAWQTLEANAATDEDVEEAADAFRALMNMPAPDAGAAATKLNIVLNEMADGEADGVDPVSTRRAMLDVTKTEPGRSLLAIYADLRRLADLEAGADIEAVLAGRALEVAT